MLDDLEALKASRRQFLMAAAIASCGVAATAPARADLAPQTGAAAVVGPAFVTNPRGYAARGFDVVAYARQGEAVRGDAKHQLIWSGARWRFETEQARDAFAADPGAYAPQFGGYCAYALATGSLTPGDGQFWDLVGGKLYLHCSPAAQDAWRADLAGHIAAAERRWPRLSAA